MGEDLMVFLIKVKLIINYHFIEGAILTNHNIIESFLINIRGFDELAPMPEGQHIKLTQIGRRPHVYLVKSGLSQLVSRFQIDEQADIVGVKLR